MFTKSDLKSGMVVETRNGNIYFLLLNCGTPRYNDVLIREGNNYVDIESYNSTLECINEDSPIIAKDYDIMRVYQTKKEYQILSNFLNKSFEKTCTLVFERKEKNSPYIKEKLTEEQAKTIAFMMLDSAKNALDDAIDGGVAWEDYDYWYGISDDWDVNIYADEDEVLCCALYEVKDGSTVHESSIHIG